MTTSVRLRPPTLWFSRVRFGSRMRRRSRAVFCTSVSVKPSWLPRRTLPSEGSSTLRPGNFLASIMAQ